MSSRWPRRVYKLVRVSPRFVYEVAMQRKRSISYSPIDPGDGVESNDDDSVLTISPL